MVRISVIETKCRGRMAVATSPISAGTVVVLEDPIACAPLLTSSLPELSCDTGLHRFTKAEVALRESTAFSSSTSMFTGNMCILAARFYLYGRSQIQTTGAAGERYEMIRNHMTTEQAQSLSGINECAILVQRLISQALQSVQRDGSEGPSIAECTEILCKLCCNLFTITDDFQNEAGIGCYPRAALLNHSCEPNCIQRFDSQANIVIRAACDIPAGAELTISYIDTGMPTWHRQQELLKSYYFHCTCGRCAQVDANDVYACSNIMCTAVNSKSTSLTKGQGGSALLMKRGTCVLSESDGVGAYSSWLNATGENHSKLRMDTSPVSLPFPQYNSLFANSIRVNYAVQLTCQQCGASRSASDIMSSITAMSDLQHKQEAFLKSADYRQYTPAEQLYCRVKHALYVLSALQPLVFDHHYSVYHVRKQLKISFEEHLPVQDGVLLFPPIKVRNNLAHILQRLYGGAKPKASTDAAKTNATIVLPSEELRHIYENNLLAMLRIMPSCYSRSVPNLCYTFYRIQLVWYMLSKGESLIGAWPGQAHSNNSRVSSSGYDVRNDIPVIRQLIAESKELLHSVKVVYGADHAFYADMQHCMMQLRRMCS